MALNLTRVSRKRKKILNKKNQTNTGAIRIAKDFSEMEIHEQRCYPVVFPDPQNLLNFSLYLDIEQTSQSYWKGGLFKFDFNIPPTYPHKAPKVVLDVQRCRIYHPNIDTEGAVCLNILKDDWTPVLDITQVFHGLKFLFLEPNPNDPLNLQAAEVLRNNPNRFQSNVNTSFQGGNIDGFTYTRMSDIRATLTSLRNQHSQNQPSLFGTN